MAKIREQKDKIAELKQSLNADEEDILSSTSDPYCDVCNEDLRTLPLNRVKEHYNQQHGNTNGYIKCCDTHLITELDVENHVAKHKGLDKLSYVIVLVFHESISSSCTNIVKQ